LPTPWVRARGLVLSGHDPITLLPASPPMGFVVRSHSCRCVGESFGMKVHYFPHWTGAASRFTMN